MCIFAYRKLPYGIEDQTLLINDELGQAHPWVVPLGTSHLDFPRPIEL
jgi:hypothetical protein